MSLFIRSKQDSQRGLLRRLQIQTLDHRRLLTADSIGVTEFDVSEILVGTVTVTPVFLESNGQLQEETQNWTPDEIDEVLARIEEGVNWWSRALDRLNTVHTLSFVIDDTFARDPVETPFEPIDQNSGLYTEYVADFLIDQGLESAGTLERAAQLFNNQQRIKNDTDWAFTIYVVDSSDDQDGLFNSGGRFGGAFALAGGSYVVTPSTRPASTIAHELGHVFWARDEYPGGGSYTDQRGYYNAQLLNASDNPDPDFVQEISILRAGIPLVQAYEAETSPASTLAFVGWRDSDGDGIFDFADVPLELDATGYFDAANSQFKIQGTASAATLRNQNSAGVQSDITLNQISELQYRLDSGEWQTAQEFGEQIVEFDLNVDIAESFESISWRVIDTEIGVTSEDITIARDQHLVGQDVSINGFSFLDQDGDGLRGADESLLSGSQLQITNSDGSELLYGEYRASDFDNGQLRDQTPGVAFSADGALVQNQVAVGDNPGDSGGALFQYFNTNFDAFISGWNESNVFIAEFDEPVGEVSVSVNGLNGDSYARVEAYDASGQLLSRSTSDQLGEDQSGEVSVTDRSARIASVRVFGHADSSVGITGIEFGSQAEVITESDGGWRFTNLPDGEYEVTLETDRLIHQYDQPSIIVTVEDGVSEQVTAAVSRVVSARHNLESPADVSRGDGTTARDALLVINDLGVNGSRLLQPSEFAGFAVDVNDDGSVTSLDALIVINALTQSVAEAEGELVAREGNGNAEATDLAFREWTFVPQNGGVAYDFAGLDAQFENSEPGTAQSPKGNFGSGSVAFSAAANSSSNVSEEEISARKTDIDKELGPTLSEKIQGILSEPSA